MKKLLFTIFLPACFFTNARAQLTASYPFNGNATDLVTGLTATVNGASLTSDRYGNPNSAYTFNGSSNISIPTGSIMTNLYTYSAWVKFATAVTGKRAVISIGDNSNTADQAMCVANGYSGQNGYVHTAYNQSSSPTDAIQGTYSVSTGVWYNIVSTKSIDTIKVYVNGALAAKAKFNGTTAGYGIAGQPKATIGSRSNNAQYFNGDIDDILIYNYAMTPAQVLAAYTAAATGISELKQEVVTGVYPSPATDRLYIDTKAPVNYELASSVGQRVMEGRLDEGRNELNVASLPAGIYFLVTAHGTKKICKQ